MKNKIESFEEVLKKASESDKSIDFVWKNLTSDERALILINGIR